VIEEEERLKTNEEKTSEKAKVSFKFFCRRPMEMRQRRCWKIIVNGLMKINRQSSSSIKQEQCDKKIC
jgi:hypothetical protein